MKTVPARLTTFLESWEAAARPFDWQARNCCHFAAAWVQSETGRDALAEVPATPDARRALKVLAGLGGDLTSACRALHAGPEIPPAFAQTGDLVLVPVEGEGVGAALGICSGRDVAVIDPAGKVVFVSIDTATAAWRLGASA